MYLTHTRSTLVQTDRNEFNELCLSYLAWGRINSNNLGLSLTSRTFHHKSRSETYILQRASVYGVRGGASVYLRVSVTVCSLRVCAHLEFRTI